MLYPVKILVKETVTFTWPMSKKYKVHKLYQSLRIYLSWGLCTLCLLTCQVTVAVGDSGPLMRSCGIFPAPVDSLRLLGLESEKK